MRINGNSRPLVVPLKKQRNISFSPSKKSKNSILKKTYKVQQAQSRQNSHSKFRINLSRLNKSYDKKNRSESFEFRSKNYQRSQTEQKKEKSARYSPKNHKNGCNITVVNNLITNFRLSLSDKKIKKRKGSILLDKSKDKEQQYTSNLQFYCDVSSQRKSLEKLQQLKWQITESGKAMVPHNKIKFKEKLSSQLESPIKQKKVYKIKPKQLPDYLEYIYGNPTEEKYEIGFDFTYLRKLLKKQTTQFVDFSYFKVLISIILCINDILKVDYKDQTTNGKRSDLLLSNQNLLKQYSCFYFKIFDKNLMESIIMHHYYKIFQEKLFPVLVLFRKFFFCLYQLTDEQVIFKDQERLLFLKCTQNVKESYQLIYKGFFQAQNQQNYTVQTLKLLKIVGEVQKRYSELKSNLNSLKIDQFGELSAIYKEFQIFQQGFNFHGMQSEYLCQVQQRLCWKYYKIPPIPFLPTNHSKRYSLIITVNKALLYYNQQKKLLKYRPYLDRFLFKMKQHFELISFASQQKLVSDLLVDHIEKSEKYFNYRLHKDHLVYKKGILIKDITKMGRDPEKTIMVELSKPDNSQKQLQFNANRIFIKQYFEDRTDKELLKLLDHLQGIALKQPQDVRKFLPPKSLNHLENIQEVVEQNTISITK